MTKNGNTNKMYMLMIKETIIIPEITDMLQVRLIPR